MMKAAFVGAGRRAQSAHYPTVSRIDGVNIEAVVELDETRMGQVVDAYGIPRAYGDYREMIEVVDPDVVYVIMGEELMTAIAVECMNAGKHVFIEKPAGASPEETQQLLDVAEANGVHCMVGFQRRHASVTKEAMRLVEAHGRSTLGIVEFHNNLLGTPKPPRTTMWNDVCHAVDLLRYMVGSEVDEVTGFQDTNASTWTNDYNSILRFKNGTAGIVTANRSSGGRTLRGQLHGVGVGCHMRIPDQIEVFEDGDGPRFTSGAELAGVDPAAQHEYDGTMEMHRHFAECIRTGDRPISDIRDVIHTSRLVAQLEGNSA